MAPITIFEDNSEDSGYSGGGDYTGGGTSSNEGNRPGGGYSGGGSFSNEQGNSHAAISKKDIAHCRTSTISAKTYTGKAVKPAVSVMYDDANLLQGTDYEVTYSNNVSTGKATMTISGKGAYRGQITKSFLIKPAKVAGVSVKSPSKGKLKVGWSTKGAAAAKVTGYRIVVKYDDYRVETTYVKGTSKSSKTFRAYYLNRGNKVKAKKAVVTVSAYKVVGAAKVYGTAVTKKVRVK